LSKLREQFATATQQEQPALELTAEQLSIAWREYILKLKTAQKHSLVTNFEMMECSVKTADLVNVRCFGELQLGFLKQERTHLLDHLQQFFRNPVLNIHPELIEQPLEQMVGPRPLSTKEQYLKLVEKYPLVKELKDRLGLELDY
jgi:DNA polymerase-3 subunit gamma/tau